MPLHPIGTMKGEVLRSGAMIFTPMELTVVALARREKGRGPGTRSRLVQALFAIDQRISVRRRECTLADARLEALRRLVNSLYRRGRGTSLAVQTLQQAGFSNAQVTWLCSECAHPLRSAVPSSNPPCDGQATTQGGRVQS